MQTMPDTKKEVRQKLEEYATAHPRVVADWLLRFLTDTRDGSSLKYLFHLSEAIEHTLKLDIEEGFED
jgi:hypothetical protein